MSVEANKALVKHWNEGGFANFEAYVEYLHERYSLYRASKDGWPTVVQGRDELALGFREFLEQYPTFTVVVDDIIGEGDKVAVRVTWMGQGAAIAHGMAFYRLAEGTIVEDWACTHFLEQ